MIFLHASEIIFGENPLTFHITSHRIQLRKSAWRVQTKTDSAVPKYQGIDPAQCRSAGWNHECPALTKLPSSWRLESWGSKLCWRCPLPRTGMKKANEQSVQLAPYTWSLSLRFKGTTQLSFIIFSPERSSEAKAFLQSVECRAGPDPWGCRLSCIPTPCTAIDPTLCDKELPVWGNSLSYCHITPIVDPGGGMKLSSLAFYHWFQTFPGKSCSISLFFMLTAFQIYENKSPGKTSLFL